MSEKKPNEPISFSRFADWCRNIDSLSEGARHTVKVLLNNVVTDDSKAAERILSKMKELDIRCSGITEISPLGSFTRVRILCLDNNQITDFSVLRSLTNLTTLYLSENRITDISFLGLLTHLKTLNLSENRITNISSLGSLTNLTALNLSHNRITNISSLGSLTNLTTLDLSLNKITITDIRSLGSLTNLKTLNLSRNKITITDISSLAFLGSLTNLTTLDLSQNKITNISSLGSLTHLTTLHLNSNQITDISSLGSLTHLTTLHLNSNQITDISSLGSLTNLIELYLRGNQITDFSVLRSLTNLTILCFDSYKIAPLSVSGELAEKRLTLSTTPIDTEKATAAVKVAYATIGLEEPEVIICNSPRETYLQIFNLPKRQYSQHRSDEWHWNRFGKKLDWRMYPSIVREFVSPAVWQYELHSMTMDSEVDSILSSLIYELVGEDEESEPEIMNCCADDSFDLISPETPTTLFKEIYLTELYISLLGINLSGKAQEIHHCQKLLLEHCGWIFPFEKTCVVCDRPRHLRFDSQNRLHAEGEPAIEFVDGWNFYYYHGVRLPEKYGQVHPNLWQAEWLLSEDNAELRRVLIQGIGYDRICQELSAEKIDTWQEYELLTIDNADIEPIYLLKMTCPSTGFIHALRVPPDLTSAREAISWVNWDIDPEEFSVQT